MTLGFINNIGPFQWLIILALGLLVFGRRLPEVGRSLGRAIVEFKKGLKGIDDEVEDATSRDPGREAGGAGGAGGPGEKYLPRQDSPAESRRVSTTDKVEEQV